MSETEDYTIQETIYESSDTRISRGMDKQHARPVIIKRLTRQYPTEDDCEKVTREYDLLLKSQGDGIVQAYDLIRIDNAPAIVMEDIGGRSLSDILMLQDLGLETFLSLGLRICRVLGNIHGCNIIHRDINPSNIIWNIEKDIVRIIDFSIATALPRERTSVKNSNVLEGTPAYISPEQTGRMNRFVDYRSDFYSLGVTFYRMLTRCLPFTETEPLKLVHNHIAVQPKPPHEVNAGIPEPVSGIIMKLMAKNAEDRYQSIHGLEADLARCQQLLQETGNISDLIPGAADISDKFQIPEKLYGREKEVETLISVFNKVRQGSRELICISGFAGIGKSSLVNEINRTVVQHGGYFVSGKFEELRKDIPYRAFIDAFTELARRILTQSDDAIIKWKKRILSAVEPNGKIITDIIPFFETIIGKQPELIQLDPAESRNRFYLVFSRFIRALADREHPLVLFLDDLQWADTASLHLLKLFAGDTDVKHLLLIGAYRHNEISGDHPLMITLDSLKTEGTPVNNLFPDALTQADISRLLSDTLRCPEENTQPLAGLLMKKTKGNPFFTNEFLRTLYKRDFIKFSPEHGWEWDMAGIEKMQVTDNVVELMTSKINILSETSQEVLKQGACIGNDFTPATIARICGKSETDILPAMHDVLHEGMLFKIDDYYRFSHDRIREAAYLLISEEDRARYHFCIGNLELTRTPVEQLQERIFEIVNHLNAGVPLVTERSEKNNLIQLNLMAGRRAMASSAYKSALDYLTFGIHLLEENTWETDYDLTLALYEEAASASQLNADYETMAHFIKTVMENAGTVLDTVKVHEADILACMARHQLQEAIRIGLDILGRLDISLPAKPGKLRVMQELLMTKMALKGIPVDQLSSLPKMNDPHKLAVMRILSVVMSSAYYIAPELFSVLVFNSVRLSVSHGNSRYSPYAYAAFGMIYCGVLDDIDKGYEWGGLATELVEKENQKRIKSKVWIVIWFLINIWKRSIQDSLKPLQDAHEAGLETGDLEFAASACHLKSWLLLVSGTELTRTGNELERFTISIRQLKQDTVLNCQLMTHQLVLNLQGKSDDPCKLEGTSYNIDTMLPEYQAENALTALSMVYFYSLYLNYLFGFHETALEYSQKAGPYLMKAGASSYYIPLYNFYDSLVMLALSRNAEKGARKKYLNQVRQNQKKMKTWADLAPMNYLNKYHLVEAEIAGVLGQEKTARHHYGLAVKYAFENKFLNEEALALELTAKFWLGFGEEKIAASYIKEAHNTYRMWGAAAKVRQLDEMYGELLKTYTVDAKLPIKTTTTSSADTTIIVDLPTIVEASQVLSSEIDFSRLLKAVMASFILNAGAQRGFLIIVNEEDENLCVEAAGGADQEVTDLASVSIEGTTVLSENIVKYVYRTGENVILGHACKTGKFTGDAYITENEVKSLLCIPITHKNRKLGILYLENNLATESFTPQRIELLRILSAQAAISIENAGLYQSLEQKVREKTTQLEAAHAKLKELSIRDPLTALHNRRYVYDYASEICENFLKQKDWSLNHEEQRDISIKDKVYGVFLIDIDHFKVINDTYGHRAGDRFLVEISDTLRKLIRKEDILVRWGGEEFLVILTNTTPEYINAFRKKVMDRVQKTSVTVTEDETLRKTCSIGSVKMPVSPVHPEMLTLEQTINIADFALHAAKENGRNRSVHIELKNQDYVDGKIKQYLCTLSKDTEINSGYIDVQHISQ